ncbi:hypothetical protein BLNAU_9845 [Blattamonas nauphoetae]|uniref:Transmembrane protein n=1 Tax=Blattamonas nauphoetae TaxID=2049346 RepID=A0ABQ9XUG0_9EUKA|nr:hypothetical protein BLNAU_9845 [Blattamonas nauphoetae]
MKERSNTMNKPSAVNHGSLHNSLLSRLQIFVLTHSTLSPHPNPTPNRMMRHITTTRQDFSLSPHPQLFKQVPVFLFILPSFFLIRAFLLLRHARCSLTSLSQPDTRFSLTPRSVFIVISSLFRSYSSDVRIFVSVLLASVLLEPLIFTHIILTILSIFGCHLFLHPFHLLFRLLLH